MSRTKGRSQTPLKSGLPSGMRGISVGAALALAFCADNTAGGRTTQIKAQTKGKRVFISLLHFFDGEPDWAREPIGYGNSGNIRVTWGFTLLPASAEVNGSVQY